MDDQGVASYLKVHTNATNSSSNRSWLADVHALTHLGGDEALARPKGNQKGRGIMTYANENKDAGLFSRTRWDQFLEGCSLDSPHLAVWLGP